MEKKGIALSGGGIKSFAQLPILKAFSDADVTFDAVSGTSMGSAIAALLSLGMDADEMTELAIRIETELVKSRLFVLPSYKLLPFSKEKIHGGYVDGEVIENIIIKEVGDFHISDVKIPLAIPSVDIITGKIVVFVSHPNQFKAKPEWDVVTDISLAKAVRASCSFPLVIAGCPFNDYLLTDGGIKMNLPSELLDAYGIDKIAAVTMTSETKFEQYDSFTALSNRIYDLMVDSFNNLLAPQVDLMLNVDIGEIWVFEFGKSDVVLQKGREVSLQRMRDIREFGKRKRSLLGIFNK